MTTVYSSKSGRCPGSTQPAGERMCATLTRVSPVLTRPANSSISFGLVPAASTRDGPSINSGMWSSSLGSRRMSATDEFLRNNAAYAVSFDAGGLLTPPAKQVAVVTCMDSRMDIFAILGLNNGEAHIIRNAGGVVTDDVIRSLAISQRKLGTREILVIKHTQCGMLTFTDDEFRESLRIDTGMKPPWSPESFADLDAEVRNSLNRIANSAFIEHKNARGFVYDVDTGKLREVS